MLHDTNTFATSKLNDEPFNSPCYVQIE
uniref:Uncharacterized protein n=1 Tax=Lepeophtheirus salmonis TaxID=72036 RepID=A0A0K2VIS8_LEPSM